jgi:hypothetical protein
MPVFVAIAFIPVQALLSNYGKKVKERYPLKNILSVYQRFLRVLLFSESNTLVNSLLLRVTTFAISAFLPVIRNITETSIT